MWSAINTHIIQIHEDENYNNMAVSILAGKAHAASAKNKGPKDKKDKKETTDIRSSSVGTEQVLGAPFHKSKPKGGGKGKRDGSADSRRAPPPPKHPNDPASVARSKKHADRTWK